MRLKTQSSAPLISAVVILLLAIAIARNANAQANTPAARAFSFEDAVNYALKNYPAIRASLEQTLAARARVSLARSQYLPQLSGVYQDSRATQNQVPGIWLPTSITPTVEGPVTSSSGQSYWGSQAAALFSWEPIDFGLRSSNVAQARSADRKANADLAVTRLEVASAVGTYFFAALAAEQGVTAAQANVNRWQVFDQSIHTLVDNDLRPGADASRADAQLAMAKTQLFQAQASAQSALAALAALMGMAGDQIRLESGKLLDSPGVDSLPGLAPGAHPLAQDQMAVIHQVQAQEKILSRTDYPRLYLQAEGFGRGSEVPNDGSFIGNWDGLAPARGNWIAGITVTFPNVFDFKALGAEKQISKANELSQHALYDKTIQDLTAQVQTALAQLKSAQLVAGQTPVELAAARASEIQSRARYDASLATLSGVAEAEGLLASAEMDDAVARLNVWRNLFGLACAQGDPQPFLDLLHAAPPPAGQR